MLYSSPSEAIPFNVVTRCENEAEARSLPPGACVGDTCGGRSFSDNVAAVLEQRSFGGWYEIEAGASRWTLIVLQK